MRYQSLWYGSVEQSERPVWGSVLLGVLPWVAVRLDLVREQRSRTRPRACRRSVDVGRAVLVVEAVDGGHAVGRAGDPVVTGAARAAGAVAADLAERGIEDLDLAAGALDDDGVVVALGVVVRVGVAAAQLGAELVTVAAVATAGDDGAPEALAGQGDAGRRA